MGHDRLHGKGSVMGTNRGGAGGYLLRFETVGGSVKWRNVPNLEHGTLCRAFGLAEGHTWFDMPSTFREAGSMQQGYGGSSSRNISGYVFQGPKGSDPIGKLYLCREDEQMRDSDPTDRDDFFKL
jgi:hypothetical protein